MTEVVQLVVIVVVVLAAITWWGNERERNKRRGASERRPGTWGFRTRSTSESGSKPCARRNGSTRRTWTGGLRRWTDDGHPLRPLR
jgi:hypothetical protein